MVLLIFSLLFSSSASADLDPALFSLRLTSPASYRSGIPILVRLEVVDRNDQVERGLWDATATISIDNPLVSFSPNQIRLYNGLGSALVTLTGSGNLTLTVSIDGMEASRSLTDLSSEPVIEVSGTLVTSQTWSGLCHITGGDFTIPTGVTLTLSSGTLVLIDGVSSGTNGTDIDVAGSIQSLGTAESPVIFTAYNTGQNWGEFHFVDAQSSTFQYTNISRGGRSPAIGHSNSGPTFRVSNSTLVFDHANLTDNAGKLMHVTSGSDLAFHNCLFSRSVMGPEISGSALLFEDSWIIEMSARDDADGIYVHPQGGGRTCIIRRGVSAKMVDDGIDLNGADITIEDFIVRDCNDKGISIYNGRTTINHCLVVRNNKHPEDPTVSSVAAKATGGATTVVSIDHTTIVATRTPGITDYGIQSHNKYSEKTGSIIWNITNSIIDATDPIDVQAPYLESDIHISYCDVFGEPWPGTGNINVAPSFVDPNTGDYHLKSQAGHWNPLTRSWLADIITSPCIDAGNPASPIGLEHFPNGGITNLGFYGATAQASKPYFGEPPCQTIVAGDINGDCVVDFKDFTLLANHWAEEK
jgi:hypothetical protein